MGANVYGLLFEIPIKDWPIIQHKEGVVTGMSIQKRTINVQVDDLTVEATAFVTSPDRANLSGPISNRFLEALIRGAEQSIYLQNISND